MRKIASVLAIGLLLGQWNTAWAAGAIAVDDQAGGKPGDAGYGVGSGDSREAAASDAIRVCKKEGNDSCKVVVRYDKCGAYASSREHFGIGYGDSEKIARAKAIADCGEDSCHIVVADCD